MAGEGIRFDERKVKAFYSKLAKNAEEIEQRKKVFWGALTALSFRDVIKHFERQKGPEGKWKKWSDLYATHMGRIGKGGNKILQDSGRMRQNLFQANETTRIKKGQLLYNPAQTKSGFGYAKAHNEGSKKLPKREFMWLTDKAVTNMSKLMAKHTTKGL